MTTMQEFDLTPDADFSDDENKRRLYRYWDALRGEVFLHLLNHGEMIPLSTVTQRVELEFAMSADSLYDIYLEGDRLINGDDDGDDEGGEELPEELINDLFDFVKMRIAERRAEDELFRSITEQ